MITERGAPPVEQTKKPLDQTVRACRPQKKEPNLSSSADADLDFSVPMTDDRQAVGGVSSRKWMWSASPPISVIWHWMSSASARNVANRNVRFSGVRI